MYFNVNPQRLPTKKKVPNLMLTELTCLTVIVCMCFFCFQFCKSKLMSLSLLTDLAQHVTADIILDRILPYVVCLTVLTQKTPVLRPRLVKNWLVQ